SHHAETLADHSFAEDEVGGALGDGQHGGVGVGVGDDRHDRGVGDAQAGQAGHLELEVDHGVGAGAHPAGAGRVVVAAHRVADVAAQVGVRAGPQLGQAGGGDTAA